MKVIPKSESLQYRKWLEEQKKARINKAVEPTAAPINQVMPEQDTLATWYNTQNTQLTQEEQARRQSTLGENTLANKYLEEALRRQGLFNTGASMTPRLQLQADTSNRLGAISQDVGARRSSLSADYATQRANLTSANQENAYNMALELLSNAQSQDDVDSILEKYSSKLNESQVETLSEYASQTKNVFAQNEQSFNLENDMSLNPTIFENINNFANLTKDVDAFNEAKEYVDAAIKDGRWNPNDNTVKALIARLKEWEKRLASQETTTSNESPDLASWYYNAGFAN